MSSAWYHDFMVIVDLGTCGAENTHGYPMRDARAESGVMEEDLMNKKTGCAILRKMCYITATLSYGSKLLTLSEQS